MDKGVVGNELFLLLKQPFLGNSDKALWEDQVHGALNLHESKSFHGALWFLEWWYTLVKKTWDLDWNLVWREGLSRKTPHLLWPISSKRPRYWLAKEQANWMETAYPILWFVTSFVNKVLAAEKCLIFLCNHFINNGIFEGSKWVQLKALITFINEVTLEVRYS